MDSELVPVPPDEPVPTFIGRPPVKARSCVSENVYHTPADDGQPHHIWHSWEQTLDSDDQVCDRQMRGSRAVGQALVPPDTGWVQDPGLVWLLNEGGEPLGVIPTPAQAAAEAARVLEVCVLCPDGGAAVVDAVPPGKTVRHLLAAGVKLRLRCRQGETRVRVIAHPR